MRKFELIQFDPAKQSLEEFKSIHPVDIVIDNYNETLGELFLIRNPKYRFIEDRAAEIQKFVDSESKGAALEKCGNWFYFEWNKTLIHYLPDAQHQEIRTARNKNLITAEEQQKFYNTCVGIAGLSVGSHCALTIAMMGGAKNIKLADPDVFSFSNLNRVRYGASAVGVKKAELAARVISEINPYASIYLYEQGISSENIQGFLAGADGSPKIDILVEEMDNLGMKIMIRLAARDLGLPVIMATDNGDGVIVDIERFDQDKSSQIFNGAIGNVTLDDFMKFDPKDMPKLATKVAGPDVVVPRMLSSLFEVGKTLYSWPQLGSAATFSGVAVAYLVRKITLGAAIKSGKYDLSLDQMLDAGFDRQEQDQQKEQFLKNLGLK